MFPNAFNCFRKKANDIIIYVLKKKKNRGYIYDINKVNETFKNS